jgi:drug/metabolite transporter (DMT)-like permease
MTSIQDVEVDDCTRYSSIPGMLVFGTATVVIQKLIFSFTAKGSDPPTVHTFEKPWFQTEAMFLGMMLCLVVFEVKRCINRYKASSAMRQALLKGDEPAEAPKAMSHMKYYLYVLAPAMCDLLATCLMNIGLLWIPASVWQMLRGSMVIFSAILSVVFLKRRLWAYNWVGIGFVLTGLIMVAVACLNGNSTNTHSSTGQELLGILLVVGAQVIQASQIVIEEFLLKNVKAEPSLIVGLEGFWGSIVCSLLLIPVYYIPTTSAIGRKFHENTLDTFTMMGNSAQITCTFLLYVFAILGYNLFGMMVTQTFTAVHRTIMEAIRTACIWVTNLIIHYAIDPKYGEKWVTWSFMQVGGFCMLLLGMFVYNKVLKLRCLRYPEEGQK